MNQDHVMIYKYPIEVCSHFSLDLPEKAKILSVDNQRGRLQMWCLFDTNLMRKESRDFVFLATGVKYELAKDESLRYITTVQLDDGHLAFHLFEVLKSDRSGEDVGGILGAMAGGE